jgi:hypothetical protein
MVGQKLGRVFPVGILAFALVAITCRSGESRQNEKLETRLKHLEAAAPGVGEIMSAIQLHFGKLFYAARARNWKLASFEVDEVKENLDKAAVLRPEENGTRLGGVVDAFEQTQLAALSAAIGKRDSVSFGRSYDEALEVCNSCHRATGRPFIVITKPTGAPVPNQQWVPNRDAQ